MRVWWLVFAATFSSIETKLFTPTNPTVTHLLLHGATRSLHLGCARAFVLKGSACRNPKMRAINQAERSLDMEEVGALETWAVNYFTATISLPSSGWGRCLHTFHPRRPRASQLCLQTKHPQTSFGAVFLKKGVRAISKTCHM